MGALLTAFSAFELDGAVLTEDLENQPIDAEFALEHFRNVFTLPAAASA